MRFYIGSDNGSGQTFTNKEDFLKELSLMIDDCEANGGTQFDITVDADASCFVPSVEEKDPVDADKDYLNTIKTKRKQCVHGVPDKEDSGFFCAYCNRYVTGCDCYNCGCWLDDVKGE